ATFEHAKGVEHFRAARDLFHQHGWRTHHSCGNDPTVIRRFVQSDQRHRTMLSHGLLRHQFPKSGVATASCAKHCGAERDFVKSVVVEEGHHRQTSFKKKGTKSSLPKMVVRCQSLSQTSILHHYKRHTIGQAPFLIGPLTIEP